MSSIKLSQINKVYGDQFHAIKDLNLDIDDGEFMVFVGPSGCGKSTALRMIAGLEDITNGDLEIGGDRVNHVDPKDRDIAMVFQSYALYPHKTVRDNIGFPLKMSGASPEVIHAKVEEVAAILELTDHLDRKPAKLSGGQRQRVAMGRAIIRKPSAFLMDEPLSNLDAKLRVQMRGEIVRLQRELGVTTIYVTHDQVEAMTMGDRVVVLKNGELQQVDTPSNLYHRPSNVFVAGFIGSPSMNLYQATLDGLNVTLGDHRFQLEESIFQTRPSLRDARSKKVILGIRPEDMEDGRLVEDAQITVDVSLVESLGAEVIAHLNIRAPAVESGDPDAPAELGAHKSAVARFSPKSNVRRGESVPVALDINNLHFFDPETRESIW